MAPALRRIALLSALLPVASLAGRAAEPARPIADRRLLDAGSDRDEWLMNGRTYDARRFSPLDQINAGNVAGLAPRWIYQTGKPATFQATPLVADGVLYLSEPLGSVSALDAATGARLWHYDHKLKPGSKLCCGPANRGAALGYGKVFVATADAHLVALDIATGKPVWDKVLATSDDAAAESTLALAGLTGTAGKDGGRKASGQSGFGANSAPLVHDGKVFAGVVGVGYGLHLEAERPDAPLGTVYGIAGRYGASGFLAAFDAETGRRVWQFDTTQAGWEGGYAAKTAYGVPLPRDITREKAEDARDGDAWRFGGGSMWNTPALDPKLGLLYFGTGNPSPQATGTGRPGDNLWTVSLVAVDAKTGKLRWGFQQVPHDLWGYDVASPAALFDVLVDGRNVPAVGEASKIGWYFVHDRRDGRLLFKSEPFVPQENLFALPSPAGVTIAPGVGGGASWSPAAVDAEGGVAYVAAMHLPTTFKTATLPAKDGAAPVEYTTADPAAVPRFGTLTALDLKHDGRIAWQAKTPQPLVGGTLATKGGLVFTGEGDGWFDAFDAGSGKLIWRFNCGAGVNAPPITYAVNGKQYVAVAAGGSAIWGYPQGDALVVFALPD